MNATSSSTVPITSSEVEQLVKQLYASGAGDRNFSQLNEQLTQLQRSPDGWNVADALMGSEDINVRFYAALTFTYKLNNEGPSLDAASAEQLRHRLIGWLIQMGRTGEGEFVTRKLCSTMVAYYIKSPMAWRQPIVDLACMLGDEGTDQTASTNTMPISDALQRLPPKQLPVLLWFADALAEDVGKLPTVQVNAKQHAGMLASLNDVGTLIYSALTQSGSRVEQAIQAYASWVNYVHNVRPPAEALQPLRALIRPVVECLSKRALAEETLHVLTDQLDSNADFFLPEHIELLARVASNHIRPQLYRALSDEDEETDPKSLVLFIVAFGCANIQRIIEDPEQELSSQAIVRLLMDVLATDGIPGDDDELSTLTIEFWNTYIENVNETVYSLDSDDQMPFWVAHAKSALSQTVELLWKKLWIPPAATSKSWNDEEHEAFKEFRLDATDLMLSIFAFLGKDMLHQLVSLTLRFLEAKRWRGVEAALFSLNTLSDNVLEDGATEDALEALFRSDLFVQVADFNQAISSQTRRTAIDTLGSYGQYIERHPEFLPDTVRFLFASLEMGGLANAAAKSIDALCSACRSNLTHELPGFLAQYQRFLDSSTNDPYTKQKVIGGVASIVQAVTPESAKAEPLLALLSNVEQDVDSAKQYASSGDTEMMELIGVSALECLACVGKGMQVPDDVPINIYEDDEEQTGGQESFWHTENGKAVQQRIIGCFSVLQVVGEYGEAIEAACQVLRSGFAETQPGPFVLPPAVTVDFVQSCTISTPQLEAVLDTASVLIISSSRRGFKVTNEAATALYSSVARLATTLEQSSNDPSAASAIINMLTSLMPSYTHILFQHITESLLDFTLSAINGTETFPKRAACDFWTRVIKPQTQAISEECGQRISQVTAAYGPKLVSCLVKQIGGRASRSDLDVLCEPLKALLLHASGTQAWLQQALSDDSFPSEHVDMNGRAKFLRHVMGARSDGKVLKNAVKTFWAECRGTVVSYSS